MTDSEELVSELIAAVRKRVEEEGTGPREEGEGLEWRTRWEPESSLPEALSLGTATRETLDALVKSRASSDESVRKAKAIKAHALLPEQEITPEVKRSFRLLNLRGVMDPKRFYKSSDQSKIPKRFQWGTVVEGPTEFYSSRMTRKTRKETFTEEILGDGEVTAYRKRKFRALQDEAQQSATRQGKQSKSKPRKRSLHKGYRG